MRLAHHAHTYCALRFRRGAFLGLEHAKQAQMNVKRFIAEVIEQMLSVGFNTCACSPVEHLRTFQKAALRRGDIESVSNKHGPLIKRGSMYCMSLRHLLESRAGVSPGREANHSIGRKRQVAALRKSMFDQETDLNLLEKCHRQAAPRLRQPFRHFPQASHTGWAATIGVDDIR
jgi:hypothetical protein